MKKNLKITLIILGIIIGIIVLDTIQALIFDNSPIIKIRENNDGSSTDYIDKGIFVNHYYCVNKEEKTVFKNVKYTCPIIENNDLKIKEIVDKTKDIKDFTCAEALESFYEDENYIYYWNCIKNEYMIVIYEDGHEETIEEALNNKTITINDLDLYNIEYLKQNKSQDNENNIVLCLNSLLGGYISSEKDEIKEMKISDIIDINLTNVDYSFIGESEYGIYAILKTDDNSIIQELDKYFDQKYDSYQSVNYNEYRIYAYNKINDFDLNENLNQCFK
ncbi:MAG: hypothetical protein ACLUFU_04010 [Bacilli bacterium]